MGPLSNRDGLQLVLTATLTATAVAYRPTGWSPCTSTPRSMDRKAPRSTL